MSEYTITISAKPYIVEYFRQLYGVPCQFPKKSFLNLLLGKALMKQPENYNPKIEMEHSKSEQWLQIALPYFENKDIRVYNYITKIGSEAIARELRCEFYLALMSDVKNFLSSEFSRNKTPYINTGIKLFIERYNLGMECFSTLLKQYQRTETTKSRKKRRYTDYGFAKKNFAV